jgi:hypothetical protein
MTGPPSVFREELGRLRESRCDGDFEELCAITNDDRQGAKSKAGSRKHCGITSYLYCRVIMESVLSCPRKAPSCH